MREKTGFNQWKNTQSVINWFKNIKDKKRLRFVQFDICDFYATISEDLLIESLDFASNYVDISDDEREIIIHAKQSILFHKKNPWAKKGDTNFDVGMGSFDGAETCELVGLFLLSKLNNLNINLGLYSDDGLGVCCLTARQVEKLKQEMCKIFKAYNLKITTDVKPFTKPNNTTQYVNKNSNHPPSITKNLPAAVNRRLNIISANEEIFRDAIPPYQKALNESGHNFNLKFEPDVGN